MLPGASPALDSTSPGRRVESCAQLPCSLACASSARVSVAAAASACCLCAATSLPMQLPPLAACVLPRLRRCSCLRSLPVRRRFSAAAAASAPFSAICALRAVFCAALCVAIFLRCVRFPQFALCALCSVTCAVPSGSCQPGCALAKLRFFRVRSPALSLHVQAVGSRGLIT